MGEISGVVYIIIGAFFAISSKIIDANNQENKLSFFIFAGIVMIVVGIVKLIINGIKGSDKKHHHTHAQCHRCGTHLHSFQEFCHRCGFKMHR